MLNVADPESIKIWCRKRSRVRLEKSHAKSRVTRKSNRANANRIAGYRPRNRSLHAQSRVEYQRIQTQRFLGHQKFLNNWRLARRTNTSTNKCATNCPAASLPRAKPIQTRIKDQVEKPEEAQFNTDFKEIFFWFINQRLLDNAFLVRSLAVYRSLSTEEDMISMTV